MENFGAVKIDDDAIGRRQRWWRWVNAVLVVGESSTGGDGVRDIQ